MEKSKLVTALTEFSEGKQIKSFGGEKTEIRHEKVWEKLVRVWNDGRGLISFATMDKGTLLINEPFCSKKEVADIKANLKVPYEFVSLCYPDYYSKDLKQMRK